MELTDGRSSIADHRVIKNPVRVIKFQKQRGGRFSKFLSTRKKFSKIFSARTFFSKISKWRNFISIFGFFWSGGGLQNLG